MLGVIIQILVVAVEALTLIRLVRDEKRGVNLASFKIGNQPQARPARQLPGAIEGGREIPLLLDRYGNLFALMFSIPCSLILYAVAPHLPELVLTWIALGISLLTLASAYSTENKIWTVVGIYASVLILTIDGLFRFGLVPRSQIQPIQPTPPPAPSAVATITLIPTLTPSPTLALSLEVDQPCIVPSRPPVIRPITLTNAITANTDPTQFASGQFFDSGEKSIDYRFDGNEIVCLASSSDGLQTFFVDDLAVLLVSNDDKTRWTFWAHDFSIPDAPGTGKGEIKRYRPEDISRKFTSGRNIVRLLLIDLTAKYHSASEIWLLIWKK